MAAMMNKQEALFDALTKNQGNIDLPTEIEMRDGLARLVISLPSPARHYGRAIDNWMLYVGSDAHKASEKFPPCPAYRGLDKTSFDRALKMGIDVEPTTAHFYCDALEKALEYGGSYPSVLILDQKLMERPFRDVHKDDPSKDHKEAREWAVGEPIVKPDSPWIRYSRLPVDDPRRGSGYESAYAWFIPGDPKDALLGTIECVSM